MSLRLLAASALALTFLASPAGAASYQEGVHYKSLPTPQPTGVAKGQVEVLEFFSWGCPHCYAFEPLLQQRFVRQKPANVVLTRVPATFNPLFKPLARAYYAAEALGVVEKINMPMFDELHDMSRGGKVRRALGELANRLQRNDAPGIVAAEKGFEDALAAFFEEKAGIAPDKFRAAYNSMAVKQTKMARGDALYRRYRVTGVPAVVVDGRYFVGAEYDLQLGTYAQYADIVANLAARRAAPAK